MRTDGTEGSGTSGIEFVGTEVVSEVDKRLLHSKTNLVFLRWHGSSKNDSKQSLKSFVGALTVKTALIEIDESSASDSGAHVVRQIVEKLWKEGENASARSEVITALDRMPYSQALEEAVFDRFPTTSEKNLAIAMLKSGPVADEMMTRFLGRIRNMKGIDRVLVLAPQQPADHAVETMRFRPDSLIKDIARFMPPAGSRDTKLQPKVVRPAAIDAGTLPAPEGEQDAASTGFYARFLSFVRKAAGLDPLASNDGHSSPDTHRDTDEDWAKLAARLAAPNWDVARKIGDIWRRLEVTLGDELPPPDVFGSMQPDNLEERTTLELRMRFLAMLYVLHPTAFESAVNDLDGADQLYRLHLILLGETAKDSLLSSALIPEWQEYLDDPLFRELFHSCFSWSSDEFSLVPRFESRTQLQNNLRWFELKVLESGAQDFRYANVHEMLNLHREWITEVANEFDAKSGLLPDSRRLVAEARSLLDRDPSAADALQAAQILLSVNEFEGHLQDKRLIRDLIEAAISSSPGGIRFDASLARARAFSIEGNFDAATALLRATKRYANNELWRAAVDIETAFSFERAGDFFKAVQHYQVVLKIAEDLGADELVARAANGCLRCDAKARRFDDARTWQLRARIMLQIQGARAPELFPLTRRNKPKLFLSYRSTTWEVMSAVNEVLKGDKRLTPFIDENIAAYEDFSPTIHQELLDSDAIVLMLSADFFNSPWCIHELHFALGQHDVRGISLFWGWCTDDPALKSIRSEAAVRRWIDKNFADTAISDNGYQRFHLDDRIKRLFENGRRLSERPVIHDGKSPFDPEAAELLAGRILDRCGHLYARARLLPT